MRRFAKSLAVAIIGQALLLVVSANVSAAEWTASVLHRDALDAKQFYALPAPAVSPARDLIAYSKDAKQVVLASWPGFQVRRTFSPPVEPWMKLSPVMRLTFSADGRTLLVAQHVRDSRVRRGGGGKSQRALLHLVSLTDAEAKPVVVEWDALTRGPFWADGAGFILADSDGRVFRLDPEAGTSSWKTRVLGDTGEPQNSLNDPTRLGDAILARRYARNDAGETVHVLVSFEGGRVTRVEPRGFKGEPWGVATHDGKTAYALVKKFEPTAAELWSLQRQGDAWAANRLLTIEGDDADVSHLRLLTPDRAILGFGGIGKNPTGYHLVDGLGSGRPTMKKLPLTRAGYSEAVPVDAAGLVLAVTSQDAGSVEIVQLKEPAKP